MGDQRKLAEKPKSKQDETSKSLKNVRWVAFDGTKMAIATKFSNKVCLGQSSNGTKQSLEFPGFLIRAVLPRYFKGADWLISFFPSDSDKKTN